MSDNTCGIAAGDNALSKKDMADIGTEVKSITLDSSGKPEWVLNSDGTVVLSESFVESGAIKRA